MSKRLEGKKKTKKCTGHPLAVNTSGKYRGQYNIFGGVSHRNSTNDIFNDCIWFEFFGDGGGGGGVRWVFFYIDGLNLNFVYVGNVLECTHDGL